jgi:hypothetical protein
LRHASPKHLIAPGSPAGTVVQALRHLGLVRASDVARVAALRLSASDKKTLARHERRSGARLDAADTRLYRQHVRCAMDKFARLDE